MTKATFALTAMSFAALAAPQAAEALDSLRCGPGAVTSVSREEIERVGLPDISEAVRQLPNVTLERGPRFGFDRSTGTIAVRGRTQVGSNQPLVVIDGRPVGRDGLGGGNVQMPPADQIETVSVLRDSAATAIYGFAGVNGVVIVTTKDHSRSAFATERGGVLVNPALDFDFGLSGYGYEGTFGGCIDVGMALPIDVSVTFGEFNLNGSDSTKNQQFLEGFGVTGVGGVPGVFVGTPTDVRDASIDVDRRGRSVSFEVDVPALFSGNSEPIRPFEVPSFATTSLVVGLRGGTLDQTEKTIFDADSPAFGLNSAWQGEYETDFDGRFKGAYIGVRTGRTFFGSNDTTTTIGLSGIIGIDNYQFDVTERVNATGLGGLLNYANKENHSFSDELVSGRITGSINWRRGNFELGAALDLDTGMVPELKRKLPGSDIFGALDPEYSLSDDFHTSLRFRFGARLRF